MSFGKAKVQRFNDIKENAPSPAHYNVLRRSFKIRKFATNDSKSPIQSETASIASSIQSSPCVFRTPTIPKKNKTTTSTTKSRLRELFGSNNSTKSKKELFSKSSKVCPKTDNSEALREKTVECENKDEYIKDLIEQLEELKNHLSTLGQEKEFLDSEKEKFSKKILEINESYENNIKDIKENHEKQISMLLEAKAKAIDDLNNLELEYNNFKESTKKQVDSLTENCEKFEDLYKKSLETSKNLLDEKQQKEIELKSMEKSCIDLQEKHSLEIEKLQREHQNEIQDLEFEMLKTMTELQRERDNASLRISELETSCEQKISCLKKEHAHEIARLKSETGVEQIEKTWHEKLVQQEKESQEILKECQAISEYNIIQCEIEKNQIKSALEYKTSEYDSLLKMYSNLNQSYCDLEKKFSMVQNKSNKLLSQLNDSKNVIDEQSKELSQLVAEKKAYEYTMSNCQVTIEVLKKRLLNSDRDVEQLKNELKSSEEKMIEYENRCIQLENDLQQARIANDELEMQFESTIRINENEIRQLKRDLLNKVETYKMEVLDYTKKSLEEESVKNELKGMLEDVKNVSIEVEAIKDSFENKVEVLETEIKKSEEQKRTLLKENKCLKQRLEKDRVSSQKLKDLQEKYDILNAEVAEAAEIRKKYIEQSGRFDELSQKFEELQQQHKKCLSDKKEVVSKETYEKLLQKCQKLEAENVSRKKIEKIKKFPQDKENIGSPNRSLNSSRVESPFRERN